MVQKSGEEEMLKKAAFLRLAVGVGLKPTKRGARLKELLLMEEIRNQLKLRLVVYPIIYKVLAPSQVVQGFLPSTVSPVSIYHIILSRGVGREILLNS